jgi:hypothetical protein
MAQFIYFHLSFEKLTIFPEVFFLFGDDPLDSRPELTNHVSIGCLGSDLLSKQNSRPTFFILLEVYQLEKRIANFIIIGKMTILCDSFTTNAAIAE